MSYGNLGDGNLGVGNIRYGKLGDDMGNNSDHEYLNTTDTNAVNVPYLATFYDMYKIGK